jgi:hypothetical protein
LLPVVATQAVAIRLGCEDTKDWRASVETRHLMSNDGRLGGDAVSQRDFARRDFAQNADEGRGCLQEKEISPAN